MSKFKVGDRVEIQSSTNHYNSVIGISGEVIAIHRYGIANDPYLVKTDKPFRRYYESTSEGYFGENDLKLIESAPNFTLIIRPDKSNPDITTATLKVGKETIRSASVKRYCKDTYSMEAAIKAVVEKMYPKAKVPVKEVKEVKRHAKDGEYIKIVEKYKSVHYENGSVLRVLHQSLLGGSNKVVWVTNLIGTESCVSDKEYVVLENYTPDSTSAVGETVCSEPVKVELPKPKRLPKIGEYIKIVNSISSFYKNGEICKVVDVNDGTGMKARGAYFGNKDGDGYFAYESEYEVLDNYTPPVEPKKPEPILIGGVELKAGCKFILKPYHAVTNHKGVDKGDWDKIYKKIHTMTDESCSENVISTKTLYFDISAIDRIIED